MATNTRRVSRAFLEAGVLGPNTKSNSLIMLGALKRAMSSAYMIQFNSLPMTLVDHCNVRVEALNRIGFDRLVKTLHTLNFEYTSSGTDYTLLISLRLPIDSLRRFVDVQTLERINSNPEFFEEDVIKIPERPNTVSGPQIKAWVMAILKKSNITNYMIMNKTKDVQDRSAIFKVVVIEEHQRTIVKSALEEAGVDFIVGNSRKKETLGGGFFFFEELPDFDKLEVALPDWYKLEPVLTWRRRSISASSAVPTYGSKTTRRTSTHRGKSI